MRRHVRLQLPGRRQGFGESAGHALGDREKVQVVAVVHERGRSFRPAGPDEGLVGPRSLPVASRRRHVVADTLVDMRGHVDEMAGRGHEPRELLRMDERPFRMR